TAATAVMEAQPESVRAKAPVAASADVTPAKGPSATRGHFQDAAARATTGPSEAATHAGSMLPVAPRYEAPASAVAPVHATAPILTIHREVAVGHRASVPASAAENSVPASAHTMPLSMSTMLA